MMFQIVKRSGIFAFGAGSFAYFWSRRTHGYTVVAETAQNESRRSLQNGPGSGQHAASLPKGSAPGGQLRLQQVQVMFRHGARTPLRLIPGLPEVEYDPQFILREHQASLFPYERVHIATGEPIQWSDYQRIMMQKPLKSGATVGTLTTYGKDQAYLLGRRLQRDYRDQLDMATYNPQEVLIFSSNIKRTVESARCVLAGFYGKEQLQEFAKNHTAIKIRIPDVKYNFLVPDTSNCAVLRKVNHASMYHSDFIPGFKGDKQVIEKHLTEILEKNIEAARQIQKKIDGLRGSNAADSSSGRSSQKFNKHRQSYVCDTVLEPLVQERGRIMARIDKLWAEVFVRNPDLANVITEDDQKALIYLRSLEVEQFFGRFSSGYRFHFYFDPNPYFYNEHLCKEVYTNSHQSSQPSQSIPVLWKEGGKVVLGSTNEKTVGQHTVAEGGVKNTAHSTVQESSADKQQKSECGASELSFFQWYVEPVRAKNDHIGRIIRDEVWANPIKFLEDQSTHPYGWEKHFDFIFGRDDLIARLTHGLPYPTELKKFEEQIEEHAVTLLYYAMTGQHEVERQVVARLCGGPLMTAMVEQFENTIEGKQQTPKLCLYSSHDSTMAGVLEVLGIWDKKWPPFAADVRLELFKDVDNSGYYIRVLYCGETQKVRGQEEVLVRWQDFKKAISKYLIQRNEYVSLCSSDILERIAKDLLKHEAGEVVAAAEAPAGM